MASSLLSRHCSVGWARLAGRARPAALTRSDLRGRQGAWRLYPCPSQLPHSRRSRSNHTTTLPLCNRSAGNTPLRNTGCRTTRCTLNACMRGVTECRVSRRRPIPLVIRGSCRAPRLTMGAPKARNRDDADRLPVVVASADRILHTPNMDYRSSCSTADHLTPPRPRQPVHQPRLYRHPEAARRHDQHGWQGPVHGHALVGSPHSIVADWMNRRLT